MVTFQLELKPALFTRKSSWGQPGRCSISHLVDDVLAFVVKVDNALLGGDIGLDCKHFPSGTTLIGGNVEVLGSDIEDGLTTAADDHSGAIDSESGSHALSDT